MKLQNVLENLFFEFNKKDEKKPPKYKSREVIEFFAP